MYIYIYFFSKNNIFDYSRKEKNIRERERKTRVKSLLFLDVAQLYFIPLTVIQFPNFTVNSGSKRNKCKTRGETNEERSSIELVCLMPLAPFVMGKSILTRREDGRTLGSFVVFERYRNDQLTLEAEPQVHQTRVFQLRQDLHFTRDVLQRATHCALTLVNVLHRVHVSGTVPFLYYAHLLRNN